MALSYLDKAIIFLLPLLVFQFFKDQLVYVSIEYIYSITTVIIPLIDLGLSGYFFYAYRNSKNHDVTLKTFVKSFQRLYLLISCIGLGFIAVNYYGFEYEPFIIFIVSRLLFVLATVFFASYYRLTNRPEKAVYITLFSNVLSLTFLFAYFFSGLEFSLWLIFIGQILFAVFYLFKCVIDVFFKNSEGINYFEIKEIFVNALLFSWPSIIQVFIMMYIANYGKLNALNSMSLDEGTLLSLTQRGSMLIQLTHASILAFLIKEIYVAKDILAIQKSLLFKYLVILLLATLGALLLILAYAFYGKLDFDINRTILVISCIISYTFLWCISAFFEVYYGRENKNKFKLYLVIINGMSFILIFNIIDLDFLEKTVIAMPISVLVSLLCSLLILKKRNYYLQ